MKYLLLCLKIFKEFFHAGKEMVGFAILVSTLLLTGLNFLIDQRVEAKVEPLNVKIEDQGALMNARWVETNIKLGNLASGQDKIEGSVVRTNDLLIQVIMTNRGK